MSPLDPQASASVRAGSPCIASPTAPTRSLVLEQLVGSALLQDVGRDLVTSGVPTGGAFDRRAHHLALDLVGCPRGEATIEIVGTCVLRARGPLLIAVTGRAEVGLATAAAVPPEAPGREHDASVRTWLLVPSWTALDLAPGDLLRIETHGRAYLAVRGGLACPTVLGSRSTCLLGPIGPAPLAQGDALPIGASIVQDARPGDYCRPPAATQAHAVVPGPHGRFQRIRATVADASRIGIRLTLDATSEVAPGRADLPSLGVLPGTIQALPSGDWMVLGPDAGTMGGYPVVGVLAGDGLDRWAHVAPGDRVELRAVVPGTTAIPAMKPPVRVGEIG